MPTRYLPLIVMRPRQSLLDLFSTFLQFAGDRPSSWLTDARLRRSMVQCQQKSSVPAALASGAAELWAQYWLQRWQTQPERLAEGHLSAYLQESCYWAAHNTLPRVANSQYLISDCFQIAIAEVPRILKKCNPDINLSLKAYANFAFSNFIRDRLRQQQEINLCSDWGLLLRLSRKQLREALEHAGMNPDMIPGYLLVWTCFTTLYPTQTPGTRKLAPPDPVTWTAIAQRYNRERQSLAAPSASEKSVQTLETWLRQCATLARQYLYPTLTSLNTPKPGHDSGEWQDELSGTGEDSLLVALIAAEDAAARQEQRSQLQTVLTTAIGQLPPAAQQLLQLYYQQNLTQQQMAQQLALPQYTVSRKLAKAREALLLALIDWQGAKLHNLPNATMMKTISPVLEEWLQNYYQADRPDSE